MKSGDSQDIVDTSQVLRESGFKVTQGRKAILDVFCAHTRPLSLADVAEKLSEVSLDEATIYRALEAFVEAHILTQVNIDHSRAYYELASHAHHHHLVCEQCGVIEDVDVCMGAAIEKAALENTKLFSSISHHSLEFFGTCHACRPLKRG